MGRWVLGCCCGGGASTGSSGNFKGVREIPAIAKSRGDPEEGCAYSHRHAVSGATQTENPINTHLAGKTIYDASLSSKDWDDSFVPSKVSFMSRQSNSFPDHHCDH
jgi:hypothetical protein